MRTIETKEVDWKAYNQGIISCYDAKGDVYFAQNPHREDSVAWQSWNYGWNTQGEVKWIR